MTEQALNGKHKEADSGSGISLRETKEKPQGRLALEFSLSEAKTALRPT